MQITGTAISLNVPDVPSSVAFMTEHFGFATQMSDDGFASLARDNVGANLIYLRTGLASFRPERVSGSAGQGLVVVFVVEDIDSEYERLRAEHVEIVTPIETEPWGERYFQVADPNGVIVQLVQWVEAPAG